MSVQRATFTRPLIAVAMVAVSTYCAFAQKAPVPTRVRGTIESVKGDTMQVKSRSGEEVKLRLASDVNVSGVTKISLADIKPGSFIGATTVPGPDGSQNAVEVHVFPEAMRGTGEGSRPWDLKPNSSMTNATVAESVVGNDGHTLLVKYKDGEKKVLIPPGTPIAKYVPGNAGDLKVGSKVFVGAARKEADGSLTAPNIAVGRDIDPPQ